jgi:hypothetical protein
MIIFVGSGFPCGASAWNLRLGVRRVSHSGGRLFCSTRQMVTPRDTLVSNKPVRVRIERNYLCSVREQEVLAKSQVYGRRGELVRYFDEFGNWCETESGILNV